MSKIDFSVYLLTFDDEPGSDYSRSHSNIENSLSACSLSVPRQKVHFSSNLECGLAKAVDDDREKWFDLCSSIEARTFYGTLVIVLPPGLTDRLRSLMYGRSHLVRRWIMKMRSRGVDPDKELSLSKLVGIAEMATHCEASSVLAMTSASCSQFRPTAHIANLLERCVPYGIRIATGNELTPSYFGIATLRRKAGFRANTSDRKQITPRSTNTWWEPWSLSPPEEWTRLMTGEFPNPETRLRMETICRAVFAVNENISGSESAHVTLAAIRLCRMLATRSLEGESFTFTVLVPADTESANRVSENAQRTIFQIISPDSDPCTFTFDFKDSLATHLEAVQSIDLLVWVDCQNGTVRQITARMNPPNDARSSLRHYYITDPASFDCNGIWIHVAGGKQVEVYSRSEGETSFDLRFDGFEWQERPLVQIRQCIDHRFTQLGARFRHRMGPALAKLLEQRKSSIIIFLDEMDEWPFQVRNEKYPVENAAEPTLTITGTFAEHLVTTSFIPMRPSLMVNSTVPLSDLSSDAIAGILQLDGAHFISANGNFLSVAQRIQSSGVTGFDGAAGSGHGTAKDLQNLLCYSTVVKISASGKEKFFVPEFLSRSGYTAIVHVDDTKERLDAPVVESDQ
ncbi:hypothetical protein ACFL2H_07030 [Planctomycetota bacterium]